MSRCWFIVFSLAWLAPFLSAHEATTIAIAEVSRQIKATPSDAALYLRRAQLYLEHQDWQACLADLEHADRCATCDLGLDAWRGKALALGHHKDQALAMLDAHLESHPSDSMAWMTRARTTDDRARAAKDFLHALQVMAKPEPDHFVECAEMLVCAGQDSQALTVLDRAPLLLTTVESAVSIMIRRGDFDAALHRLDTLIAQTTIQEPLLARRASLLAQAGREAESIRAWESLLKRIEAMPMQARGSHAMSKLTLQAQQALASLHGTFAHHSP